MATTVAELVARLALDASNFHKGLADAHKGLGNVKSGADSAGGGIGGFIAKGAGILGVVGGVTGVGFALKSMADEAMEANKGIAQTDAVLKSTHGAAGMTAQSVTDLADHLKDLDGIDDDVVRSAENMLLTFTNIHKDTFPQATQTALDMSVALGTDATQSAMMLGKALNDPIQGVGALRRVGVQLTDEQEKAVKVAMEHGNVTKAQAIILGELQTEFGGSAKAAGDAQGPMGKFNLAMGDLHKAIGNKVLPVMARLAEIGISVIDFFEKGGPPAQILAGIIGGVLVIAIGAYAVSMASAAIATIAATWPILAIIAAVAAVIAVIILLVTHWNQVTAALRRVWDWLGPVKIAIAVLLGPIGLVIAAVVLLVSHWNDFSRAIGFVIGKLGDLLGLLGHVKDAAGGFLGGIHVPGFASGGVSEGGLAMVGEHGPEVVALPGGSRVYPSGTGPGGGQQTIIIELDGRTLMHAVMPHMVSNLRMQAGTRR